ncbi:hypothetical protein SAMN04515667_0835 [Formosa sp. Hel1_31_208]|uniref:DUF4350 domain-containing protein n=1 Tax=Formosa sp. Hel1_31_208 TaxID=1798225 RepID=UPI000879D58C|nr:DUF4350 domain-containing protein [Formosa sp. Hel1_31_208]SDR85289.1 hypothetical protein SAMN04515667_0835 [Formosa sp. Hel1_31_208]
MFSKMTKSLVIYSFICCSYFGMSQQVADSSLVLEIENPYHKKDKGPTLYIDEAHHNFHTKEGRFKPFSTFLENDGYVVKSMSNYDNLKPTEVLVISNAIHSKNIGNWQQPIYSAFNEQEINRLTEWVKNGGRLLIIADHMPFSGAANELANAFGFDFCDGFAQLSKPRNQPDIFSEDNDRLISSPLTDGTYGKAIKSVTTFTGSSFQIPSSATGILKFKKGDECAQPEIAWQFDDDTKAKDLEGHYQGAIMNFSKGKLAVFGEAAQFTAQTITNENGTFRFGFHSEDAPNNMEFLRNLMLWLSAKD